MRLGKDVCFERNTAIANYNAVLDSLMQQYREGELTHVHANVRPVGDNEGLHSLVCAAGVGVDTRKQCPVGASTEILKEIVDWIDDPSSTAPRIFWLHSQDAKGMSSIANMIALHARNCGQLGSHFCFARERQAERLHEKLFPTIARDLAARDIRLKPILADALAVAPSLGSTRDIMQQWKNLILEPLARLKNTMIGKVIVSIDGLDESGDDTSRKHILRCLMSTEAGKLPSNLRILVTSRPLADVCKRLKNVSHIKSWTPDDIKSMGSIKQFTVGLPEAGQLMKMFVIDCLASDFISVAFYFTAFFF